MSGSVLVLGTAAASTLAAAALIGALTLVPASHEVQGASESAALSAAQAAAGWSGADPCEFATQVAAATGSTVTACECDERGSCAVRAGRWQLGIWLESRARAGVD